METRRETLGDRGRSQKEEKEVGGKRLKMIRVCKMYVSIPKSNTALLYCKHILVKERRGIDINSSPRRHSNGQ